VYWKGSMDVEGSLWKENIHAHSFKYFLITLWQNSKKQGLNLLCFTVL